MSTPSQTRPRQVTLGAWMIMIGSVLVVLTVWETVSSLRSIETREAIEDFIGRPPGSGMGLDVESVTRALHVAALVSAGCATAAGVLGWQVLQGSRSARVALTVLALPLFLSGLVTGGFLSSLVAAASLMLWLSPAKEWFRGDPLPPPSARAAADPPSEEQSPPAPPASEPPPAERPYGTPPADEPESPWTSGGSGGPIRVAAPAEPYARPTLSPAGSPSAPPRPGAVVAALLITLVVSGLVAVLLVAAVALVAASPEMVYDEALRQRPELRDQGVTPELMRTSTFVLGGLCVVWALAAAGFAVAATMRRRGGLLGLRVCAALTAALGLIGGLVSPALLVPGVAAASVLVLLARSDVKAWYAAGRRSAG